MKKKISSLLLTVVMVSGCGQAEAPKAETAKKTESVTAATSTVKSESTAAVNSAEKPSAASSDAVSGSAISVKFGYDGQTFTLHMLGNDTAAAVVKHVGTADWNLPIYHFDDFENCEVMQYYDIPSRYEIPDNSALVTEEKAGEVYYSEPNRIILFYHDAQVSGEYTKIGNIDVSDELVSAVENNPVIEGWGNKIVCISRK